MTNGGTYTILVHENAYRAPGPYSLSIESVTGGGCSGTTLACGQTINGQITKASQMNSHTLVASAGEHVILTSAGFAGMVVDIYNSSGSNIISMGSSSSTNYTFATADLYTLLVHDDNYSGTGSYGLSLTVFGGCVAVPTVSVTPTNLVVPQGAPVIFTAAASGPAPLYYQWRFGTNHLMGATNSTYIIPSVQPNNVGGYAVIVSNPGGSVTNSPLAQLSIGPVVSPIANTNINEQVAWQFTPAGLLSGYTYSLGNAPPGMTVSAGTGAISWNPTEAQGPSTSNVTFLVTQAGSPLGPVASKTFSVTVNEVNVAPVLTLPTNTNINELVPYAAQATATDADTPANPRTFALVSGPNGLTVSPTGTINWTPGENQGPGTFTVTISVTDTNAAAVNAKSLSVTNSYTIVVNEVNVAPVLTLPANTNINELVPYTAQATATDADFPTNARTFALVSGPNGLTVSSLGAINWTPGVNQGPSTNTVTISVTDTNAAAVNAKTLTTTASYTIIVNEVNSLPVLPVQLNRTNPELTLLVVTNTAIDTDFPTNTLTYTLLTGPTNATIDATGIIRWTPLEHQGPSTNVFMTRVTDSGLPPLSATNTFTVFVTEVNAAPQLFGPTATNVTNPGTVSLAYTATDSDLPANTLTFVKVSGAAWLSFTGTGTNAQLTGTPPIVTAATNYTNVLSVVDNGTPAMSGLLTVTITVNPASVVNTAPRLPVQADRTNAELTQLVVTNTATDTDLPANVLTYVLLTNPPNATIDTNGIIRWTPTEAQGPSTNVFTTKVTDNGTPALSATNSFTVFVTEFNTPPLLNGPRSLSVTNPMPLNQSYTAEDFDRPANTLTFQKVSGAAWVNFTQTGPTNAVASGTPPTVTAVTTYTNIVSVVDSGSPVLAKAIVLLISVYPVPVPGTVQFAQPSYSVGEANGLAILSVIRTNGRDGAVGVTYATSNGGAAAGSDYTATNGLLVWTNGDTAAKSITVPILNDLLIETNETFTVTLTNPTGGATLGTPATTTVRIVDNDGPTCYATRQLPAGYVPGTRLLVTIDVTPPTNSLAHAVEDMPPVGWTVGLISEAGVYDTNANKVKFGPFFDANVRSLTYELTPPTSETGVKAFAGIVSVSGVRTTICGPTLLDRLFTQHPADNNPADFSITIDEVTAYGAAWRGGTNWPVGPNPILMDYVTRAGFLWRSGDGYTLDPAQPLPLGWVPVPSRLVAAARIAQAVGTRATQGSWRLLPPKVAANTPTTVTLIVTPSASNSAYAAEDVVPTGWSVGALSNGGSFDTVNRRVKWGPFFDTESRTFSYEITPTNGEGSFAGAASFDGSSLNTKGASSTVVTGPLLNSQISPPTRISADEVALPLTTRSGYTYVVEASDDLSVWTPVWTNTATTGSLLYREASPGTRAGRFYRAIER